uniref:NAD(P)-binding domain-containing protein n=1 Tax=Inhella sp. TaxID=1921806 RepID=UPI0035AEF1FE
MNPSNLNIAFIGLGAMGGPMAGHLQAAGHRVTVFNRSAAKALAWAQAQGGQAAASPQAAAQGAQLVCLCVGRDDDVREVVAGPQGVLASLAAGSVVV